MVITFSINSNVKLPISGFSLLVIITEWNELEFTIGFTKSQRNWLELIGTSLPLIQDYCQHLLSAVALASQVMNIPKDGDFAASWGTCSSATVLVKLFIMSNLNLPSHILWPLPIVIPSTATEKSLATLSLLPLCYLSNCCMVWLFTPWPPFHQIKQSQFSQPLVCYVLYQYSRCAEEDYNLKIIIWSAGHTPPSVAQYVFCLICRESSLLAHIQSGVYSSFSPGFS